MITNAFEYEIDQYLQANKKYFATNQLGNIKKMIVGSNKSMAEINSLKFKSPVTATILSLLLGWLGIDRLYTKNYIMAFIKFSTVGLCLLWWIADIYIIQNTVKQRNLDTLYSCLLGKTIKQQTKFNKETVKNLLKNKEFMHALKDLWKSLIDFRDTFNTH